MSSTDTNYTARFLLPEQIERGRANALECAVYRDGALITPSAGTVSVYDGGGTALVDGDSVTIASSRATYSLLAATIASSDLGEGWRVEWALDMPDGVTHPFRNDAALVRTRLYPVVTDADLFRWHPDLDPTASASLAKTGATYQVFLDEAWTTIQLRLINRGNRPNLITSPSALRELHLMMTLELVFRHLSTTGGPGGKWAEMASDYAGKTRNAWSELRFLYDDDDDGEVSDPHQRRAGQASFWLNGRM